MIQKSIPNEQRVNIDFETGKFSRTLRILNPTLYQDGAMYHCLLGPDEQSGIIGSGSTPTDAIDEWELNVKKRISPAGDADEVAQYVLDSLSTSKKDVW